MSTVNVLPNYFHRRWMNVSVYLLFYSILFVFEIIGGKHLNALNAYNLKMSMKLSIEEKKTL